MTTQVIAPGARETNPAVRAVVLATERHGLVTAADLRRAGLTGAQVQHAQRTGLMDRLFRGMYLVTGHLLDRDRRTRAALEHAGEGGLLSGLEAARLLGLRWVPSEDLDSRTVLVDAARRRRGESAGWVTVRRTADLGTYPPAFVGGIPVAPVAKVVLDASREAGTLRDTRGLVLGALADKRCSRAELYAALDTSAKAGTAHVRRALRDAERGAVSPPEAEAVDVLVGRGVPFYVNCGIEVNGTLLGVADLWLVGRGVGGELDSKERHGGRDALDGTLTRDKKFHLAGLWLEHVTPARSVDGRGAAERERTEGSGGDEKDGHVFATAVGHGKGHPARRDRRGVSGCPRR